MRLLESIATESGVVLQLADGTIQACNNAAQKILGLTLEQLQGWNSIDPPWQAIHEDGSDFPGENHPAMVTLQTGQPCSNVVMGLYKPGGKLIWIAIDTAPLWKSEPGSLFGVVATFREITPPHPFRFEAKAAVPAAVANPPTSSIPEELALFANSLDVLAVVGLDGYFKQVNPIFSRLLGYSEADLLSQPLFNFLHPDDRAPSLAELEQLKQGQPTLYFHNRYRTQDGFYRWFSWTASPQVEQGVMYCVGRDITRQKETEIALQESQTRLTLVNSIAREIRAGSSVDRTVAQVLQLLSQAFPQFRVAYSTVDQQGWMKVMQAIAPPGMPPLAGLKTDLTIAPAYLEAMQQGEAIAVEDITQDDRVASLVESILAGGTQAILDIPLRHSAQLVGLLWFDAPSPHVWSQHEILTLQEVAQYLEVAIQNALTQQTLQHNEERWQLALQGSNDGVWDWNVQTNEVFFSTRWKTMLGYEDLEISNQFDEWASRVHPDDLAWVTQAIDEHFDRKTPFYVTEHRMRCKDGTYKWILDRGQAVWDEAGTVLRMTGSHTDITDRRELQAALETANQALEQRVAERTAQLEHVNAALAEREALYRTLSQNIPNGAVHLFDRDLRFLLSEGTELAALGMSSEAMVGKTIWDVFPPETCNQVEPLYRAALAGEMRVQEVPYQGQHYVTHSVPVRNSDGAIVAGMILTQNITPRKQMEAALQESRATLQQQLAEIEAIYESAPIGLCVLDTNLRFVRINQRLAEINGLPIEAHLDRTVQEVLPELAKTAEPVLRRILETGEPLLNVELRGETPAQPGVERIWLEHFLPLKDGGTGDGQSQRTVGISIVCEEITERKQTEAALRQSNAILNAINESTPTLMYVKDVERRMILANPALFDLVGKPASEIIGFTSLDFHQPREAAEQIMENDRLILETGQIQSFEEVLDTPVGKRYFLSVKSPYRDEQNQIVGLIGISTDITDLKQIEAQLRQQTEQLVQANRIKDEFLAILSHELRTPLNPILGWAKLLQMSSISEERLQQGLTTIERNAKLQVQLIDDLLDIARIIRGKLALNFAPLDLTVPITAALEAVHLAAEAKSLRLEVLLDSAVGQVQGDAGRLQQVLWNLLSNAIKFTPHGGRVTVRLTRIDALGDWSTATPLAQIEVSDTGRGIQPHFLPHVFELFRQQDSSTTRQFGGLGLGLAIARQVIEAHGGIITVESTDEGEGATFTIQLPLMAAVNPEPPVLLDHEILDLQALRVLVVDDEPDSLELIQVLLEQEGAIVTTVSSASKALQALTHSQFDLLISDIGMPETDGYSLIRRIRTHLPPPHQDIPAIALTAYASETDQQKAIDAGFQLHLAKPIDTNQLIAAIVQLIS